ncbi:hypothetical protein [Streptomyces bauhiniae]
MNRRPNACVRAPVAHHGHICTGIYGKDGAGFLLVREDGRVLIKPNDKYCFDEKVMVEAPPCSGTVTVGQLRS